jgi:hypothetical protein
MVDPRTGNVHVANDSPTAIQGAVIEVSVDGHARRWSGDVGVDAATYVGHVDLAGAIDVETVLTHPTVGRVANRYPLLVLEAGGNGSRESSAGR